MSINKKLTWVSVLLLFSVLLSGCGLLNNEGEKKIDPTKEVTYEETGETKATKETTAKGEKEAVEDMVMTELYLLDKDGYVVPQTLSLSKTEGIAKQAIDHLVQNGPVTDMLPNGFKAVLPADTQASVNIKDSVATVDFSKEFANYKAEDEVKILQAVTWTLTQFDSVETVKLQINGNELTEMPVNKTPIGNGLTRASGINIDTNDVVDLANTRAVTVYYLGGEEDSYYYVPVTKRVSNKITDNVEAAVNELIEGPNYTTNLLSDFVSGVELIDKPKIENGKVTLNFNESIFGSFEEKMVSQHLINTLVLSLTEQKGIESVSVLVNGKAELVNEKGEKLTEPVTRPEKVNTGSF